MHWDVVQVRPEKDYWLFVRFKDGLAGLVQLHESDMYAVLAPLRDTEFFRQVSIDRAPDAMYAQVLTERRRRIQAPSEFTGST